MRVYETLVYVGEQLHTPFLLGSVPEPGSGEVLIQYANKAARLLFGDRNLAGTDLSSLMATDIAAQQQKFVREHLSDPLLKKARDLTFNIDGTQVETRTHLAHLKINSEEYLLILMQDQTENARQMKGALQELGELRAEAERSRGESEASLRRQETLSNQVSLLLENLGNKKDKQNFDRRSLGAGFNRRQLFVGLLCLVILLGGASVASGTANPESLAVLERLLLVLTGAVAALTSGVLDPRNKP